jgi:hypothetical protein
MAPYQKLLEIVICLPDLVLLAAKVHPDHKRHYLL